MITLEQGITLLLGLCLSLFQGIVLATVYGLALTNHQFNWVNSTDVSVSKSLASLGNQGPIVSIVVLFSASIFAMVCYRQKLLFPLLPLLYGFGAGCFALLPVVTMDMSTAGHSVLAGAFIISLIIGLIFTTRAYRKQELNHAWMAMQVLDWIAIAGMFCSFSAVIYGLTKDEQGQVATQLFTSGEFILGFVLLAWLILISVPQTNLIHAHHVTYAIP